VVKVFCDSFPGLGHFGEFLSGNNFTVEPLNGSETAAVENSLERRVDSPS